MRKYKITLALVAALAPLPLKAGNTADTARIYQQLDQTVPDWRQVNKDKCFLDWLNEPEAGSGAARILGLRAAYSRNDGDAVLGYFMRFLAVKGSACAPNQQQPMRSERRVGSDSARNDEMVGREAQQIVPSRPSGSRSLTDSQRDAAVEDMRNLAAVYAGYKFYLTNGDVDAAGKYARSTVMSAESIAAQYGDALAAIKLVHIQPPITPAKVLAATQQHVDNPDELWRLLKQTAAWAERNQSTPPPQSGGTSCVNLGGGIVDCQQSGGGGMSCVNLGSGIVDCQPR